MLSIGKLAAGQAEYYLEQARGPTTRARAVGSGIEDYYLGGSEAPGDWMGDGARLLGLGGVIGEDALRRVLSREHPVNGSELGRSAAGRRVPGFDVTFSAPKSVSVLFGAGDDRMRGVIRAAHDRAVADAFGYLERHTATTRRGAGGVHSIPGRGLTAAVFRHQRPARGIRSCIRICWWPMSRSVRITDGRRSMGGACTPMARQPGISTRHGSVPS